MRHVLGWTVVLVLCCAPGLSAQEKPPEERLREAQTASDEMNTLWNAGRYADAMARGEHALALREAVLGGTHPDVARSLETLGAHFLLMEDPIRAQPLLERALALEEAAPEQKPLEVAQTLTHLADLFLPEGRFERAEPLYERALAIREAVLGQDHPLVAESLHHLAELLRAQGSPKRAEPLFQRALAIREGASGQNTLEVARALNALARAYSDQGLLERAEPLFQRARAILEAAPSKEHLLLGTVLVHLVDLYCNQGLSSRARPLEQRARAILEAAVAQNPPNVAEVLTSLAQLDMSTGLFARVELFFSRALAIHESVVGKDHLLAANSLFLLAVNDRLRGWYDHAEPRFERALALWEKSLGKNHVFVADAAAHLGSLYLAQGLYDRAEPLLQRALVIREATFGERDFSVALVLGNLGSLYLAQGLYDRAEPLLERTLAFWEATGQNRTPRLAESLNKLGNLYLAQGSYARARPLLERALAITEAAYGKNDPDVADMLQDLANVSSAQRFYGQAGPLYERALAIRRATAGENYPRNAEALNHLAMVHVAQHRLAEALPLLTHAFAMSEHRLRQEGLGYSESRLASLLQLLRTDEERLYTLLRAYPDNARVRRLALAAALLLKGRSVEESADVSRTVYQSLGVQERASFERLRELRTQLAKISFQGPGPLPLSAYQQRLKDIAEQGDVLEADLAQRSAPLRALAALPPPSTIVDRVAQALPRDGALVEFITYADRPLEPGSGTPEPSRRYLALVLWPDSTLKALDLGPAEPINLAATRLRDALANQDATVQRPAQALYQLVFQPLRALLGETHHLFLSPDGQLALVPFAALHDGHQFLVESFDFTYLTSGKELLPRPGETVPTSSVVVLADPNFSEPPATRSSTLAQAPASTERSSLLERSASLERFFSSLSEGQIHRTWSTLALPGTRQEAEAIQRLLPQAQLFLGSEATKERLLHLATPGILHLATHGFFLEDAPAPPEGSRALGTSGSLGDDSQPLPRDPLLRSGLVLAGARTREPGTPTPSDPPANATLVTALELAGLNLWGTQLVVLSACDTGRGEVHLGQGVYGLRRAFMVAGAETMVMSLWKVDDETTRGLMEAYYTNLLAGQGRASALREAMRGLRTTQPHPHDWAPFIVLGRDAPLRELRPGSPPTAE